MRYTVHTFKTSEPICTLLAYCKSSDGSRVANTGRVLEDAGSMAVCFVWSLYPIGDYHYSAEYDWISSSRYDSSNKKASIRWQDSARRKFQAGLIGDVGL